MTLDEHERLPGKVCCGFMLGLKLMQRSVHICPMQLPARCRFADRYHCSYEDESYVGEAQLANTHGSKQIQGDVEAANRVFGVRVSYLCHNVHPLAAVSYT